MRAFLLLLCLFLNSALHAQEPDFAGSWKGDLDAGAAVLPLILHLNQGRGNSWTASMDSPAQGATGLPVNTVEIDGTRLVAHMDALSARYEATWMEGRLVGRWFQSGQSWPLTMDRLTEEEPALNRPQEPQPPFPYEAEDIRFPGGADGVTLAGTLTLPSGQGPFPALILASGSGPQDRDGTLLGHKPFKLIADQLTRVGIAVLRYDDRGVGQSSGDFATATTADFAQDMAAAFRFLTDRQDIASSRIALGGHSEGTLIAAAAAGQVTPAPAAVLLIAPPGADGGTVLKDQLERISIAAGIPADQLSVIMQEQDKALDTVRAEASDQAIEQAVRRLILAQGGTEDNVKEQAERLASPWFRYFIPYDPQPSYRSLDMPVLALFGSNDLQVHPALNAELLRQALADNPSADIRILPGLNHLLQDSATGLPTDYGRIEQTMAPIALTAIVEWTAAVFDKP